MFNSYPPISQILAAQHRRDLAEHADLQRRVHDANSERRRTGGDRQRA